MRRASHPLGSNGSRRRQGRSRRRVLRSNPRTLTELADQLHLAPADLVRRFMATTGLPDQNYFARRFKAHCGLSAMTYRARFATGAIHPGRLDQLVFRGVLRGQLMSRSRASAQTDPVPGAAPPRVSVR
jgi:AraC-like DNA-binding protein